MMCADFLHLAQGPRCPQGRWRGLPARGHHGRPATCPTSRSAPTSARRSRADHASRWTSTSWWRIPSTTSQPFAAFPGCVVSIHPETSRHPLRTLDLIRSLGARPGIAIDPALPICLGDGDAPAREPCLRHDGEPRLRGAEARAGHAWPRSASWPTWWGSAAWTWRSRWTGT